MRQRETGAIAGEANGIIRKPFAIPRPDGGMRDVWWTCRRLADLLESELRSCRESERRVIVGA